MNLITHNLFPTLVSEVEDFLTEQQCNDIVNFSRTYNPHKYGVIHGDADTTYTSSSSALIDIQKTVKSCSTILDKTDIAIKAYSDITGIKAGKLDNSWISYQRPGSQLLTHTHPSSLISAVVYLKVNDDSSKIYFHNPNPYITFTSLDKTTPYTFEYQWFHPKQGSILIFPSWLSHGSNKDFNQSEERIILSFNTYYNRSV
jgi:uncharacterized protein (TIGR02466 family)